MITPLPQPPSTSNPSTFDILADAFIDALPTMVTEVNAIASDITIKEASAVASAEAAQASATTATNSANISTASANFKGLWSSLTGALNKPASVHHLGAFWALNTNLANVTTAVPGVSASWTRIKVGTDVYAYDNRATLRSLSPSAGDQAIVDGLGYFVWESASTEPDDDESAFATASGVWLLQAASWDLVDAWQAPDDAVRDEFDEDATGKILHSYFENAITVVAAQTRVATAVPVQGASIGDAVVVTRSGVSAVAGAEGIAFGVVTSANTVTVYFCGDVNGVGGRFHAGTWRITVIKS